MNYVAPLLFLLLERPAPGADPQVIAAARQSYERYKSSSNIEATEQALIVFGKSLWPYWQAFFVFMEQEGKHQIKAAVLAALPDNLAQSYSTFLDAYGQLEYRHKSAAFEKAFTPEENMLLQDAIIEGKKKVETMLVLQALSEKKTIYDPLVERFKQEQQVMFELIEKLKAIKEHTDKWDEEIDMLVRYFEKGFAQIEVSPTAKAIQEKIDWYQGQIDSGNF